MNPTFYLLKGTLRVAAKGFWYTSGGEKGSFGYYPHLKNESGVPVYPDTQLHGDLLMAARWAKELGVDGSLIDRLFGRRGEMSAALLHIGDLAVSDGWKNEFFQIKPRIEIDDATRSVIPGMLANFEAAWMDGLTLEAPLYTGYFSSSDEMKKAQALLEESAQLLSGFGAFRSRGYGRGVVTIVWDESEAVTVTETLEPAENITYRLTSLVNVRSKPVAVEQLQLVSGSSCISADQLRGWFVRTLQQVTGNWPTTDEMAGITFSDLYPSGAEAVAYPPPVTTLRKEDGTAIDDYWGRPPSKRNDNDENFLKCKLKPLKQGSYIDTQGKIVEAVLVTRMRNAMEEGVDGGDFRTKKEGGLFVQQHLASGTVFAGTVRISEPQTAFGRLAAAILTGLKPTINGCLFSAVATVSVPVTTDSVGPCLVVMPLSFDPNRPFAENEGILLGTGRRYSPVLGRPRRGRPQTLPGSVLVGSELQGTVAWNLFGKNISQIHPSEKLAEKPEINHHAGPLAELKLSWKDITRSQAGVLRELLNTDHNVTILTKYLKDLRDKHAEKSGSSDPAKLYGALVTILEKQGIEALQSTVSSILDYLKVKVWWEDKKNRAGRVA
jgi:hypothetical protein